MILTDHVSHRPWPLPEAPWILHQAWNDFLFLHWAVDAEAVRALVPEPLALDLHEGACYLGVIPFHMSDVRPRGTLNVPGVSAFPELNVRTYVTVDGKPGVYFLSLEAHSRLAVEAARLTYDLPYYLAQIDWSREGQTVSYRSERRDRRGPDASWRGRYTPHGEPFFAAPGTRRRWLSERYCLYTVDARGAIWRSEVHHLPWPLREVEVEIEHDTMAASHGIVLPETSPIAMYSPGVDVVVWSPVRVS